MIYRIRNGIDYECDYEETEELANKKLAENREAFLKREEYRFTVCKVVTNEYSSTWSAADLENDPEDFVYQVFNQYTGLHEPIETLSAAILRRNEIIEQFFTELGFDEWVVVDSIP